MKDKKLYVGIGIVAIIVVGILIYFLNNKNTGDIKLNTNSELKSMINDVYKLSNADLPDLITQKISLNDKDVLKSYTGLSNNDDVEAIVASEPVMSSQAYSFVAVKFKNGVNIEKVKEEMYNNIDMNKWLCVSADVLYLTNYGNTIIYVMSEEDWAKPVYDAFKMYVNNSNGKELIKNNSLDFEKLPEVQ